MPGNYVPVTGETAVNGLTAGDQNSASIAVFENRDYLIVWADESTKYIYGQRFHGDGTKFGSQFEISSAPGTHSPSDPTIVSLESGGFAVAWTTLNFTSGSSESDVTMRIFDANGTAVGDSFVVHAPSTSNQNQAKLTALTDGSLIVTWSSYNADQSDIEIIGRRFSSTGVALGAEFGLSPTADGVQSSAVVEALSNGRYVASWHSVTPHSDGLTYDVFARIFDANGPVGDQFIVNTTTLSNQMRPSVAALADGNFVIVWDSYGQGADEGFGVYGQRFDSSGNKLGAEFRIPTITADAQDAAHVSALSWGGFAVAWESNTTDGSGTGVYGRIFDAAGNGLGDQFRLNTYTAGNQSEVDLAGLANGGFAAVWQSDGQDGASNGVYARLYAPTVATVALNNSTGDFNGDGRDDLLWRSDDGALSDWLGTASGGWLVNDANAFSGAPNDWHVIGTGDFNADGRDDILWRNDSGTLSSWLGTANGGFSVNDVQGNYNLSTDWQVVGIGAFWPGPYAPDDLLIRNMTTGGVNILEGTGAGGFAPIADSTGYVSLDWQIVGVGNFDNDADADILWRNSSGTISDWLSSGRGFVINDNNAKRDVPTDWNIVGLGDFNGDNRDDILWRSDSGLLSNWLCQPNGSFTINDANALIGVPTNWRVDGVGDFNGDGRDDILWRDDNGVITNWLSTPSGGWIVNDAQALAGVPTSWQVQSPDYYMF